jgi:hypothetical protein
VSFLITAFVIQAAVVKTQEPETKPADKGEVADLLAKLRKSDQPVVETCLEGCDEAKPSNVQKVVGGQVVEKPAPEYPVIAKAAHASGDVVVQLIVDEGGQGYRRQSNQRASSASGSSGGSRATCDLYPGPW